MTLTASQMIYTNVEADRSPMGIRGHQTLFQTRLALTSAETLKIENRLFYVPGADKPRKHVFFRLPGKVVLGQVVPLAELDQYNRSGRYFAHVLVFAETDFARLGNDPFALFAEELDTSVRGLWKTTIEETEAEVHQRGDWQQAHIPPLSVPVLCTETAAAPLSLPGARHLLALLTLARRAERLSAERRAVAFYGAPNQMFRLLRGLFALLPVPLRLHCSFDTLFAGGSLSHVPYWGIGLPADEPRRVDLLRFNLQEGIFSPVPEEPAEGAYELWLQSALDAPPRDLAELRARSEAAFALAEYFDRGCSGPAPDEAMAERHPNLFAQIADLRTPVLRNRAREVLTGQLGKALAQCLTERAVDWIGVQGLPACRALESHFPEPELLSWVQRHLATPGFCPAGDVLDDLCHFAQTRRRLELQIDCLHRLHQTGRLAEALQWIERFEKQPPDELARRRYIDWVLRATSDAADFTPVAEPLLQFSSRHPEHTRDLQRKCLDLLAANGQSLAALKWAKEFIGAQKQVGPLAGSDSSQHLLDWVKAYFENTTTSPGKETLVWLQEFGPHLQGERALLSMANELYLIRLYWEGNWETLCEKLYEAEKKHVSSRLRERFAEWVLVRLARLSTWRFAAAALDDSRLPGLEVRTKERLDLAPLLGALVGAGPVTAVEVDVDNKTTEVPSSATALKRWHYLIRVVAQGPPQQEIEPHDPIGPYENDVRELRPKLQRKLEVSLRGKRIAKRVLGPVYNNATRHGPVAVEHWLANLLPDLEWFVLRSYRWLSETPDKKELKELLQYSAPGHTELELMCLFWDESWSKLAEVVRSRLVDGDELFERFTRWALARTPYTVEWGFFRRARAFLFCPLLKDRGRDQGKARALFRALLGVTSHPPVGRAKSWLTRGPERSTGVPTWVAGNISAEDWHDLVRSLKKCPETRQGLHLGGKS